ncbi:hypothetical protein EAH72_06350 [Pseudomonas caspiana]|nr:hypothetical protein EAH72_06350 [Pseudomonas caspiana]
MGAGLLAKAVDQSIEMLNVPASSRASPLPHWIAYNASNKPRRNPGFVVSGYPAIIRRILRGI